MRLFCDLHIHSCLSPCGDELMTPNNIAGMAMLKGLDAIAVADHNSARTLPARSRTCAGMGVLLLPAMELTTAEEAHLLSYFPTVEAALAWQPDSCGLGAYLNDEVTNQPGQSMGEYWVETRG